MKTSRKQTYFIASFFGAIVIIVFINRLAALFTANESIWPIPLGVVLLTLAAVAIPWLFNKYSWSCPILILIGIPFGIFIDVIWDGTVNSIDRNLFPIEIALWWATAVIPVFLGFIIGRVFGNSGGSKDPNKSLKNGTPESGAP